MSTDTDTEPSGTPRSLAPLRGTVVFRLGSLSGRARVRTIVTACALVAGILLLALTSLALGDLPLSPGEVMSALLGQQSGIVETVVVEWRLPRMLGAVLFGAALGVSGAIFQSLTRNALASPDMIGLSAGSYAGALVVLILLGEASTLPIAIGSLIGGLGAAILLYLFAYRNGIQGFRLIVVGLGLAAMFSALSVYLLLRAKLEVAMAASIWGAGSLAPVGWPQLVPSAAVILVVLGALVVLATPLHQLELGDDAARALGSRVERSRLWLVICAVALTSMVTAATGPIGFVALAAPQVARRLTHSAGIGLAPAALVGSLLLVASDIVAQHALPMPLPVGVVTVVIGGAYLIWLLTNEARRRL